MFDKSHVCFQGPTLRKGTGGNQENDFVIIEFEKKAIICICIICHYLQCKASLAGKAVPKAVKQTEEVKSLLEKYFASELKSGEWIFVGMMNANKINTEQPLCISCCSFVIQGPSELLAKLSTIEADLIPKSC